MKKRYVSFISTYVLIGILVIGGITGSIFKAESTSKDSYDLLIICPEIFKQEVQVLVDHKESHGIQTKIMTLEDIRNHKSTSLGRDDAEKMKYYIYYAINEYKISYVLLIGGKIGQRDSWYLPVRYVAMDCGWESHIISDLYFADTHDRNGDFSSWDEDNDGIYGEWVEGTTPNDTFIDLYPDVAIGRLPCRNTNELQTAIEKIIFYEIHTKNQPWFNTMIALAGDTYPVSQNPLWVGYEGEYYANMALSYMNDFNPVRMYLSENGFSGPQDVINALNPGCGFVYFVGHGNPRSWGNHPPDSEEFVDGLQNQDMNKLNNKDRYPVCVVSGCHNNQFDVSLLHILTGFKEDGFQYFSIPGGKFWRSEWAPECWGWKMLRLADSGSIVTFGTTALGNTKEDKSSFKGGINELEVELFHQYGSFGIDHAGDLLKNAVHWYLDTYPINWSASDEVSLKDTWVDVQVVQSYILFGDPSLKIGGY
jgi:hypothetical protein